ncbi:hypothetical protein Ae201684P_020016 [Aphanomyces euteiches]|nr:hypothetical protein Ae201684P_020016 [Aphanomyces euteiches]
MGLPDEICRQLKAILQSNGVACGQITREILEATLSTFLDRLGHRNEVREAPNHAENTRQIHVWNGRMSKLPKDFEFPAVDAATAWRLWLLDNAKKCYPPYRYIVPLDLSSSKQRKVLSDWKFVLGRFEFACLHVGLSIPDQPTEEDAVNLFEQVALYIRAVCSSVPSKRIRRVTQLKLVSLIRTLRKAASNNDF